MRFKKPIAFLLAQVLLVTTLQAANLNETAIAICDTSFGKCAETAFDAPWNNTPLADNLAFKNCTTGKETCYKKGAYIDPQKSKDCYVAAAGWRNLYVALAVFFGIAAFSFGLLPATLKFMAWGINKCVAKYPDKHSFMGRIMHAVMIFSDANGDGKVSAGEFLSPKTLIGIGSVSLPAYFYGDANDRQAKCDYENDKVPEEYRPSN